MQLTEYFRHLSKRSLQYLFVGVLALLTSAVSEAQVLPRPDPPFQGKADINPGNSTPDWPRPVTAPGGAPNIVVSSEESKFFAQEVLPKQPLAKTS